MKEKAWKKIYFILIKRANDWARALAVCKCVGMLLVPLDVLLTIKCPLGLTYIDSTSVQTSLKFVEATCGMA